MKDERCSFYENRYSTRPTLVMIEDFLTDDTYKNQIERLRDCVDEDLRTGIKDMLPCATISGVCEGSHGNFRVHNGFLCGDIDGKQNPHITDWVEFIMYLKLVPEIWFCGLSAGGNGCFFIVRIKYPAKHREHFLNIERFFRERLDIVIDPKCINENRLRYQSYNTPETSWFNLDAPVWKSRIKIVKKPVSELPKGQSLDRVKKCIEQINAQGVDITAGDNWLRIGCAFINEFGESGRAMFHEVSKFHVKYNYDEADKKYSYWMKRGYPYTIRTFFFVCKKFGVVTGDGR